MKAVFKKTFSPTPVALGRFFGVLAILSFCLFASACSDLQSEPLARTASVSFSLPKILIQKSQSPQVSEAQDGQEAAAQNDESLWLELALKGGYSDQRTVRAEGGATVTFSAVPVGIKIWAEAAAYKIEGQNKTILYEGKSAEIVVAAGENPLSITMKKNGSDTPQPGPEPAPEPQPDPQPEPQPEPETTIKIYVSAQDANPAGSDETGDGTEEKPLASIEAAIQKMDDAQKDWVIVLSGTLTEPQTVPASLLNARSVTVRGKAQDCSDGIKIPSGETSKAFSLGSTTVPVTLESILVEAYDGNAIDAAGKLLLENSQVKQSYTESVNSSRGVNVTGSLTLNGSSEISGLKFLDEENEGGVYVATGAKLFMNGGSKITGCASSAGGGLYVLGEAEMNDASAIESCSSSSAGGGVLVEGRFTMNGDSKISRCASENGGGGVDLASGTFTMNDNASVSECSTRREAGGVYVHGGTFTMNGGSVSQNTAGEDTYKDTVKGGGVCVGRGASFAMNGGTIGQNSLLVASGFESFCSGYGVYNAGTFSMKGAAQIQDSNDVFLDWGDDGNKTKVTIAGALEKSYAANIVVSELSDGSQSPFGNTVLDLADGADTTLPKEFNKFTMPQNDYNSEMEYSVIQSNGTVGLVAAGDIVFTDGTAVAWSDTLSLDDGRKAKAAAVIFYEGSACTDDGSDTRILGVGLKQKSGIAWCTDTAYGKDQSVISTVCEGSVSGGVYTFETGAVKDGSGNFEKMKTAYGSNYNAEDYPAYEWVNAYSSDATSLAGTDCAVGWYIPSVCEMAYLYLGLKNSHVNDALELCGGTKFDWTETNPGTANNYWSSSQYSGGPESLERFNFNGGILSGGGMKTYDSAKFCAVRQF